ncbi:GIY-YIG nuclease family protein [Bradyrhizobium sp. SZCCHNS3002]|uniref:GIY-YIG nuclease family protein n=1 Tax=Bradyrhizobium TaxID=374 RepID=UPI0028EA460A|nr:GIY-YIG nuclease family protein [Bradyrhizobium sp. SZCCHNS3002]
MSTEAAWTVYILASGHHGTLYIGVTNDVRKRLEYHRAGRGSKFVSRYKVFRLVYVERFARPLEAIAREKQLKNWHRDWKVELIETDNPDWSDLSGLIVGR